MKPQKQIKHRNIYIPSDSCFCVELVLCLTTPSCCLSLSASDGQLAYFSESVLHFQSEKGKIVSAPKRPMRRSCCCHIIQCHLYLLPLRPFPIHCPYSLSCETGNTKKTKKEKNPVDKYEMQEIAEDATSPEIREHAASPDGMDKRRRFSVILPFSVSSVK